MFILQLQRSVEQYLTFTKTFSNANPYQNSRQLSLLPEKEGLKKELSSVSDYEEECNNGGMLTIPYRKQIF